MTKVRQDAWSHEDDLLLAETVLRHIREGSTQLEAFEEVGDKLNRTGAACGFRWNAIVRKKYEKAIELAKKQRKELKRTQQRRPRVYAAAASAPVPSAGDQTLTLNDVIAFLQNFQTHDFNADQLAKENEALKAKNRELEEQVANLEKELNKLKKNHQTIEEDYQALINIMDRARRMVMLEDDSPPSGPTFKMDKNGNLEKLAK
ncbi:RsfA family transcriptional regulator [Caenibacillus caldisaponilyticus]|jgi:prespore-specific regulator|uniref:RsfA family transcriptional regulator n=1 Tax=Caenibacillus caldisaponilyticus TaxID=1674942 RepID=UPI000988739E|nr:RsfA family transcriptional regulator [Caenibacillus caldisaponilyticus]